MDTLLYEFYTFMEWGKWLFLLAFLLTLGDLKFGIEAARFRKEKFKRSRAVRRTINKIANYCVWVVMAYAFGEAFGKPFGIDLLPVMMLLVIYGVELESIYVNYFESKGKKARVNIFKFFSKKAGDIIEYEPLDKENNNQ